MLRKRVILAAFAAACLPAAPALAADAPGSAGPATTSSTACPQSPTAPFMVDGSGSDEAAVSPASAEPASGSQDSATACVPPTLNSFDASPNPVDFGGSVTLSWSVSSPYPLSCNVSSSVGGFTGGAGGSWTAGPLYSSTYFELYCWDAYGDGNTWGLTVAVSGSGGGSSSHMPTGWLDTLTSSGRVAGWSCDWDSVGTPIYVHVYADGAFVGQVLAAQDRPDVAAAGWPCNGTGNHGFSFQLPNYLLNGQPHTIQVYGINIDGSGSIVGSGNTELSGSPATGTFSPPPPPPPSIAGFAAGPDRYVGAGATTISWSSSGSVSCRISSDPAGGSWSNLPGAGSVTTPWLSPTSNGYLYTLTCGNSGGSSSAQTGVAVFPPDQNIGSYPSGHQNLDPRTLDSTGCKWYSESNHISGKTVVGLEAERLTEVVNWCVKGGYIQKVTRTVMPGGGFFLSLWHFEGIASWGPCNENCDNYTALFQEYPQKQVNIWVEGHWQECMSLPVIGGLCIKDDYPVVGVLIKGDGHRVDTYSP
jgi:hypothetical protein